MKQIGIFTIADLHPKRSNLKTQETVAVIEALLRRNIDIRVYARTGGRLNSKSITPTFELISKSLTLLDHLGLPIDSSYYSGKLFDHYAKKVNNTSFEEKVLGMYSVPHQLFSNTQAKKYWYKPTMHYRAFIDLFNEESTLWKQPANSRIYISKLKRFNNTLEATDVLITNSSHAKESFLFYDFPEEKIRTVHLGVNIPSNSHNNKTDEIFNVLFVADTTLLKGLQYLIQAAQLLNPNQYEFHIVGNVDLLTKKVLGQLSIPDNIVFHGHKPAQPFLEKADVFFLPSLTEGSSRAVYEAAAHGLPCIVTDRCGSDHFIKDNESGFIVPIRDTQAIAEKLEYLRNNPDKRIAMGKKARENVSQFTWEKFGDQVADIVLHT